MWKKAEALDLYLKLGAEGGDQLAPKDPYCFAGDIHTVHCRPKGEEKPELILKDVIS